MFFKYLTRYFRWSMDRQVAKLNALVVLAPQHKTDWNIDVPIYVIPNSIPFYPNRVSTCENKQAIIVGRYTEAKGYDYMIEAWRIVHSKHPDWTIHTYAIGEDEERVRQKIQEYGLKDTIIMNKPIDNIMDKYLDSSIYVMSSIFVGFPMVLIEAMSCGVPCVSFDCPYGPRNIITDGEDGYLIECKNSKALADGICKLIENDDLRKEMGKKGRRNILRYSRESIMWRWVNLFETIIKEEK